MNAEVSELVNKPFAQILADQKLNRSLLHLANKYFNLPATDCETSRHYYYERLKTIKNKPMAQKKNYLDKKYILRNGTLLYYNSTHFNNDTLTDKIAESAIKKFPRLDGLFLNDKERKVLEAMDAGVSHVQEAEADLQNDPILKEIVELVKHEQYEEARGKAETLTGNQVVLDSMKSIDEAEEKAVEAAIKKEEDDKKKSEHFNEGLALAEKAIKEGRLEGAREILKALDAEKIPQALTAKLEKAEKAKKGDQKKK